NDEKHIGFQWRRIIETHVARKVRTKSEAMPAAPDVRRVAIFAIPLGLKNRIDGATNVCHGYARHCRRNAVFHGTDNEFITSLERLARRSDHRRPANLRHLPPI